MIKHKISVLLHSPTFPAYLLIFVSAFALVCSNTGLAGYYSTLLDTPFTIALGDFKISKAILLWINDGLMAIFFLLVGLEVKREVLAGELSSIDKASLPIFAALGGIAVPSIIYVICNLGDPVALGGWAIPAATDIAFALGVLALVGPGIPKELKVLLLAIAIIDDLAAIIIIAIFYTESLSYLSLGLGGLGSLGLLALNRIRIRSLTPYLFLGTVVWVCFLKSGIHATLAGVVAGLAVPLGNIKAERTSPLLRLEHGLQPWIAFFIVPVFAFANAGVTLEGLRFADIFSPIPLGIGLGLFIGKQLGVFSFVTLSRRLGICSLPKGVETSHIYGLACLTGVGFTMSLFIGTLAFDDPHTLNLVRLGVILGSALSGILGFLVLRGLKSKVKVDLAEQA